MSKLSHIPLTFTASNVLGEFEISGYFNDGGFFVIKSIKLDGGEECITILSSPVIERFRQLAENDHYESAKASFEESLKCERAEHLNDLKNDR